MKALLYAALMTCPKALATKPLSVEEHTDRAEWHPNFQAKGQRSMRRLLLAAAVDLLQKKPLSL
jgi:hypothetical protein